MTALWHHDPILYHSHDITWPLYPLCTLVLNLPVDSSKCSSFGASIVCISPHQISWVSIILILLHCRKDSPVYFSINLLTTAECSYLSLDMITDCYPLSSWIQFNDIYLIIRAIYKAHTSSDPTCGPAYKSLRAISQPHIGRLQLILDNPTTCTWTSSTATMVLNMDF